VGVQRLDILAAESVVLELKVKLQLGGLDQAQTISYVKTAGKRVGLVFNFGSLKPDFKRVYFSPRTAAPCAPDLEKGRDDLLFPALTGEIIGGLFEVHATLGPGFVHRIYANACYRELQARGLAVKPLREMTVYYRGNPLGQVKLRHLQVEDKIMLFPVAIYHQDELKLENLRHWMADQGISLGILANFYAETLHPIFMRVKC
jgi:GxxExxY protein